MFTFFSIKRYIEQLVMFPFILIGKILSRFAPLEEEYDIFFFFPGFAIGGAERVNSEIIKTVTDKKVIVFFTKKSPNDGMKHFFELPHVRIKDISVWSDNKWIYWANLICRGICSSYINSQIKPPKVFIGQCNFGYKLTPHLQKGIRISELIHMYDPKFTWVWGPFVKFINQRIIVGEVIFDKFREAYEKNKIPNKYLQRFVKVFYRLEYIPEDFKKRSFTPPLRIYYAGRGGPQKRVSLIISIINGCREKGLPVEFKLAGPFKEEIPQNLITDGTYVGEIQGGKEMYHFHQSNDILLMTSAWEGFPLVIMEAMVFGSIPLVTDVDSIPEHLLDGQRGFLISSKLDPDLIVQEAVKKIEYLTLNTTNLHQNSKNCFDYACRNFSGDEFKKKYRDIILGV